jgi:hypothetical protein
LLVLCMFGAPVPKEAPRYTHDTLSLPIIQVPLEPSLDWPLRRLV